MITAKFLRGITAEARPLIERQLDDAEVVAGLRDVFSAQGGDWGALKALIKSQIQDERDEAGDGKRIRKIRERAGNQTAYADMLGLGNMNEDNFSAEEDFDPATGEILEPTPIQQSPTAVATESNVASSSVAEIQPATANQVPGGSPANGGGSHEEVTDAQLAVDTAHPLEDAAEGIVEVVRADVPKIALGSDVEPVAPHSPATATEIGGREISVSTPAATRIEPEDSASGVGQPPTHSPAPEQPRQSAPLVITPKAPGHNSDPRCLNKAKCGPMSNYAFCKECRAAETAKADGRAAA